MLLYLSLLLLAVAVPLRRRYGLSWWGAIWRAWIIWVASVALGVAASNAVSALAPREEDLAAVAGIAAWLLVGVWFVLRFPGAVPAGVRHQQERHAAMRAELAAVETRRQQPSPAREAVGRLGES
jgi:hypothetical protein